MVLIIPVVAVVNTKRESLELVKWVEEKDNKINYSRIGKELTALATKLFVKISRFYDGEEKIMVAYGESSSVKEVTEDKLSSYLNEVTYYLYEGYCQDEKKLHCFMPKKTLETNTLSIASLKNLIKK